MCPWISNFINGESFVIQTNKYFLWLEVFKQPDIVNSAVHKCNENASEMSKVWKLLEVCFKGILSHFNIACSESDSKLTKPCKNFDNLTAHWSLSNLDTKHFRYHNNKSVSTQI
jgi:hypothetical protein